jgi:glycosyltransferase involved in cell wall biosynthesis
VSAYFSILILTLNEEANLPGCLASIRQCDDIVVLDSCSTDQTEQIAKDAGVRFFRRPFDNYGSQRNFGLNEIEYKNPWVLMVDADEKVPPELFDEINTIIKNGEQNISLYRMKRKDFFLGGWIKHSSGYPTWFGRLVKVGEVKVERAINEEYVTEGKVGLLKNHLHHYPFNKGFAAWLEKHNRYSSMEAQLIVQGGLEWPSLADFFHKDPAIKRKAVKSIVYRMPGRPLLMFLVLYIFRMGFLDGKAGFTFCLLRFFYEFMINCKVKELCLRKEGKAL